MQYCLNGEKSDCVGVERNRKSNDLAHNQIIGWFVFRPSNQVILVRSGSALPLHSNYYSSKSLKNKGIASVDLPFLRSLQASLRPLSLRSESNASPEPELSSDGTHWHTLWYTMYALFSALMECQISVGYCTADTTSRYYCPEKQISLQI